MESEFASPPTADSPPGPDTFAPEPAPDSAADTGTISLIPPKVLERITIAPPAGWIVERTPDVQESKDDGSNPFYLLDWQHHAGRHESYHRMVRRLDTMNAVHQGSQWRLNFDPTTEHLTIHALNVRRGDRVVDNAKPDRLRVLQREEGLEMLDLCGHLTVVVLLEDVRAGDILDVSYTVHFQDQVFPNHFWNFTTIYGWRLRDFHLSVRFPAGHPMRWKSNDAKLAPVVREDGPETEWSWQLSKLDGCEPEPNVPAWHFANRWIQVTDFASWAEVVSGLLASWQEDLRNPEILRLVESISAEAATPALRAERALNYLQDQIRYLSVDTAIGGGVPASPGLVIKRGFGDCKDKAFAAAHLLRHFGIPARPVLVNTDLRQSVKELLPTPAAFNHVIVEYEVEGRRRWVDVTHPLQGGSVLSRPNAQFRLGLPVGPAVEDMEEIPSDKSVDYLEVRETFLIDTSGRPSSLRVRVIARGREAERWRNSLAHDGVEAFARQREQSYQQLYSGAHRVGNLEWQDDRANNELELAETFDVRDIVIRSHDKQSCAFQFWAHSIQSVLRFAESRKRTHPWEMRFPCHFRQIIEIDSSSVPKSFGRTAHVEGKAFRFACHFQHRPGFASVAYDVQVLANHVPAHEFEAHKTKVREAWPYTILTGQLPVGSMVPWKMREAQNVLSKKEMRAPEAPRSRAVEQAASAPRTESGSIGAPAGEVAPPLASRPARDPGAMAPRQEKSSPSDDPGDSRKRDNIKRPNIMPVAAPIDPPVAGSPRLPHQRSRRSQGKQRRKHRERHRLVLLIGTIVGAAILVAMFIFLLHVK